MTERNQLGDELTGDDALIVGAARILERGIATRSDEDALSVLRRRLAEPQWSSELPTEPGPYWHRFEPDAKPEPVQVVRTADGKLYRVGGFSRQLVTHARGEWQRIPEPRS
jgi:hypothetical protein